jgi:hypothetical protein
MPPSKDLNRRVRDMSAHEYLLGGCGGGKTHFYHLEPCQSVMCMTR